MFTLNTSKLSFVPRAAMVACALLMLTACAEKEPEAQAEAPQVGSLTRHFKMVDVEGRNYGHIMLDPLGGGKVIDAEGRVIGYVVGAQQ